MSSGDISVSEFNLLCRICLKSESDMKYLFEGETANMLNCGQFMEVYEDDGLPTHICGTCEQELIQSYAFKQKCSTAQSILKIKLEVDVLPQSPITESNVIKAEFPLEDEMVPPWLIEEPTADIDDTHPIRRLDECESDGPSEHSDYVIDSEQSAGEASDQDEDPQSSGLRYVGKDKTTIWAMHPQRLNIRRGKENIEPGVKLPASAAKIILDVWKLFFSDDTIVHITNCTNNYLQLMRQKYTRERDCPDTSPEEVLALFGLLYMAGVKKAGHVNLEEMWIDDGTTPECFRAVMSRRRFYNLLEALRFDDINDRAQRKTVDNLAPIRQVFEEFVSRCLNNYQIGEYATIDEMLPAFRGKCKFRQYIANKPSKHGIKIYALVDSLMFYVSNLEIYAGEQPAGLYHVDNRADSVVKRLARPILNTGRNLTTDNYFTSIPLAKELLQQNITIVGTLRKNKREIPPIFVNTKDRLACSSMFAFSEVGVLVSYVPKKNKNLLLLSTLHAGDIIDKNSGYMNQPEIVTFYNATKGGVDVVDVLISQYSVARVSCRWPLTIFFCLLNIAGINSQIIHSANTEMKFNRRIFLKELALELMKPHVTTRLRIPNMPENLRVSMRKLVGVEVDIPEAGTSVSGTCSLCPRRKNRKTKKQCCKCNKYLCNEHAKFLCAQCLQPSESPMSD